MHLVGIAYSFTFHQITATDKRWTDKIFLLLECFQHSPWIPLICINLASTLIRMHSCTFELLWIYCPLHQLQLDGFLRWLIQLKTNLGHLKTNLGLDALFIQFDLSITNMKCLSFYFLLWLDQFRSQIWKMASRPSLFLLFEKCFSLCIVKFLCLLTWLILNSQDFLSSERSECWSIERGKSERSKCWSVRDRQRNLSFDSKWLATGTH